MAKFVFSGDPHNKPDSTTSGILFGIQYEAGQPFEVHDEAIADHLRKHSHFTEVKGKKG